MVSLRRPLQYRRLLNGYLELCVTGYDGTGAVGHHAPTCGAFPKQPRMAQKRSVQLLVSRTVVLIRHLVTLVIQPQSTYRGICLVGEYHGCLLDGALGAKEDHL